MLLHPQAERSGERGLEAPSFWLHSGSQGIGGQSVTATVCLFVSGREVFFFFLSHAGPDQRLWWYFIGYVAATALRALVTVVCFHVHISLRPNEVFKKIGSPQPFGRVLEGEDFESELPHSGRLTCDWSQGICLQK